MQKVCFNRYKNLFVPKRQTRSKLYGKAKIKAHEGTANAKQKPSDEVISSDGEIFV
jgi:hypothetical protein